MMLQVECTASQEWPPETEGGRWSEGGNKGKRFISWIYMPPFVASDHWQPKRQLTATHSNIITIKPENGDRRIQGFTHQDH